MDSRTRWALLSLGIAGFVGLAVACGSSGASRGSGATSGDGGATSPSPESGVVVGALDGGPQTVLPPLPALTNVVAIEREDSVGIDFDPMDKAVDYRVYPLPKDSDVTVQSDGSVTIKNAVYRCAGIRQAWDLPNNIGNDVNHPDAGQQYNNKQYAWTATVAANPTLGYVYVTPASDRTPVYAIGVHPSGNESGWRESRPKIYTTDATLRKTLLSKGGRDDGIVFYVPSAASTSTATIYHSEDAQDVAGQGWTQYTEYYFGAGDMQSHAGDTTPPSAAFQVLTSPGQGTQPLMAVFYQPDQMHVELAVGKSRFERAAKQGPGPLWHLEWSGVTQPTTLVVEALASGCPFQGLLSPQPLSAPPHQGFFTLDQLQKASPTTEVYVNGQYDLAGTVDAGAGSLLGTSTSSPVILARSFVQVAPRPHAASDWDWFQGFNVGSSFGTETPVADPPSCDCSQGGTPLPCDNGGGHCGYWTSPTLDFGAYEVDDPNGVAVFTHGQILGQLWEIFDDWAQDVTGTLRFTAPVKARIDTDPTKFLHVTFSVNAVSTDRRYPQLIVTDTGTPIQDGFANPNGNTLLLQTIQGPSMRLEVEAFHGLVNGNPWAVNNQAPEHAIVDYDDWNNGMPTNAAMPPAEPVFEHAGMDRQTKFDAYLSSRQLFVFVDGTPAGCTQLPGNGFALSGPVAVTFGDVLYHEGAEDEQVCSSSRPYPFMHVHECTETKRHWDDLGFKSGVGAPAWDFTNFPCAPF